LTTLEAADLITTSKGWLEIVRLKGYGPPYIRLSPAQIRYRRRDLIDGCGRARSDRPRTMPARSATPAAATRRRS
jgi:hypothetical protein